MIYVYYCSNIQYRGMFVSARPSRTNEGLGSCNQKGHQITSKTNFIERNFHNPMTLEEEKENV